uniref:PH domain-containing protein n=1 Tax=Anopheles atroparvus TaxID=41427 RepID=A0AAG5DKA8_ANOAO
MKKQHANKLQVAESNKTYETRELSAERTLKPRSDHGGAVRTRLLKNPTVLDTLDSVHRSLLFNNLSFEPDERQHLNVQRSSNGSHASATTSEQASNAEELLETAEATRKDLALAQHEDQRHGKVNIAPTSAWSEGGSSEAHRASSLTPGNDDAIVDGAEETLEDWNNNIEGESRRRNSVKMMVQQYEKSNESARNTVSTSARTQEANEAGRIFSTEPPVHRGASMYDVETSDFESASVTSGSSAADGGWRSVRTSSAFSEGSRDVASIDRFDLVVAETQGATVSNGGQQQDEPGGHNTMITININYRCDTNPLRTSNGMTGAVADAAEKTVDIVVSAPAQAVDFKPCASGGRKLKPCSETFGMDDMRQLKKAQTEAGELMDLEEEQGKSFGGADEVEPHNIGKENRSSSSNQNKTDHHTKQRRSSQTTNRSCQTPEHEEYHDCDELHDSTLSFYEQASSQPVTPQDAEKKRRSAGQNCSSTSSSGDNNDVLEDAGDQPMIRIVQELTEDNGEVTSTITLNKAQIKEMQRMNGSVGKAEEDEKPEKRRKSRESGDTSGSKKRHDKSNLHRQQRIIDDNFCNEILDSTIHFDRLYGINRGQSAGVSKAAPLSPSPTRARLEECFSDSVVCDIASPGDESFDSSMSVGKLEGKPRYSGKTMGRLMMKRLKKLQQATTKGLVGPIGSGGQKLDTSDASTSSSQMLQTSGPKKPPRTFANSPKRTAPSCPMRKDLDDSEPSDNGIGWKVNAIKPKSHQVGWTVPAAEAANGKNLSIPAQVYSMLHYSEDESRKRLIKTGNSQPAPQQSSAAKHKPYKHAYKGARNGDPLGPKLDIDTVDGATTPPPRRHSSSTDFDRFVKESNVKSTPHRRGEQQQHSRAGGGGTSSAGTRRLLEQFLSEERQTNATQRKLPAVPGAERRRRTTGGIFERRRQQQENFLDDARRSNHEPRRRKTREAVTQPQQPPGTTADECCPMAARRADSMVRNNNTGHSGASVGGKVAKRRTFRKAALLKRTRTLFEASKKKIWSIKKFETPKKMNTSSTAGTEHCPMAERESHGQGEFQSFDDLNLDNVAHMGDFLSNIRRTVDGGETELPCHGRRTIEGSSFRQVEVHGKQQRSPVEENEEDEPIYQEISPKGNKTILNEFISKETNKRYLMVNNNPNILYATDEDKTDSGSSGRAREQERDAKVVTEPPILRERVEDRFAAGVTVRREHERFQQRPAPAGVGNGRGRGRAYGQRINDSEAAEDEDFDQFSFEKDIIVEERKEIRRNDKNIGATNVQTGPGGSGRPILSVLKKTNNVVGAAPLGCFDTDSEIESLRRYEDKEIEELVVTLQENVTLSDMGSLETGTTTSSVAYDIDSIGYDTVDLAPPVARVYRCAPEKYDHRNVTVDTVDVSELISHPGEGDTFATSNVSPIKGSPSSGGKNSTSSGAGSTVMRNLKDKLRSSFRKSKSFIKSERQRFASYLLEERPGSKASTATTPSSSCSSSTSSSPQKRSGKLQQNNAPLAISDQDTVSGAYRSLEDGSSAIGSMGSMMELSNQYMSELILQIKRQADARKQLKQALAICRTTREFECSPELIEAERLLLLATLKETAARNELSRIDYASNGMTLAKRKRVGVVALNHFEFPLKETAVSDALFNYFYVVVCTYKDQVKGTVATERRSDGRVYFRDCEIRFHDLDADYEIRVEVFVLRLRKNMKNYSFESRYHLDKDAQKRPLGCPSPSKKLREAGRMLSFRSTSPKSFDFDNEFSRFKSQGFLTLTSFALLTSSGGELPESERTTFDATYATARTDCRSDHATTFLSVQEGGEPSASNPYYSVSSNFQQLIRRQGNENVFLVEDFKYLTLDSMAYTSNMAGTIGMSVNSEIRFEGSDVCGFLDVGEKGEGGDGISWNRRWCKMNGFALEFWNYPQECQEKQPIQCIDLIRCVNERIELAERSICSRPRTVKVDIFASKLAAAGVSCNSSGIGSYKSTGATTSPNSVEEAQSMGSGTERLQAMSPTGGRGRNNVRCFLLATDTQADLKRWLNELNRVVKFLKEWKI